VATNLVYMNDYSNSFSIYQDPFSKRKGYKTKPKWED